MADPVADNRKRRRPRYARTRHQDDDYHRIQRQQLVLLALRDKLVQPSIIPQIPGLIAALQTAGRTDLAPDEMAALACVGPRIDRAAITALHIDGAMIIPYTTPTGGHVSGYTALNFGKTHPKVYSELTTDHPIDLCRFQVANCYMGRAGLINSGGESKGASDISEAVTTAVINKRAGGQGLISGRKAFQKPMAEGISLLNTIQDVYLSKEITIA